MKLKTTLTSIFVCFFFLAWAGKPSNPNVSGISANQVTLSWDNGTCGSVSYILQYKDSTATSWVPISVPNFSGTTNYVLDSLNSSTTYMWRVRCGGAWRNGDNFTTLTISCNITSNLNITDASCDNTLDGSIDLSVSGGTAPYSYLWSNGITNQDLIAYGTGTYSVLITDSVGCTQNDTGFIDFANTKSINQQVSNFTPNPLNNFNIWSYDTLTIFNNGCDIRVRPEFIVSHESLPIQQSDFQIQWHNGLGFCPLQYTIDNNGNAHGFWEPNCNAQGTNPPDSSGYIVTVGTTYQIAVRVKFSNSANYGTYTAAWESFEVDNTGNMIQSLANPDTVSLSLVNCANFSIDSLLSSPASCNGLNDGSAMVSLINNGSGNYDYLWSNGASTQMINNLSSGMYTVTVNDLSYGCSAIDSVFVNEPDPVSAILSATDASCFGLADGTLSAQASGGSGTYDYIWMQNNNPFGGVGSTLNSVPAGVYSVMIVDLQGCGDFITPNITINEPSILNYSTISSNNTSCDTLSCNGSFGLILSGGTTPYSFIWSNGDSVALRSDLCGGSYSITATDANNCITFTENITVFDSASSGTPFNVLITGTNPSCYGSSDGSASATIPSGSGGNGNISTLSYCNSNPWFSQYSNIDNVRLIGNGDSISNNTSGICDDYSDFTNLFTTLTPGQSYNLDLDIGTCDATGTAFIDMAKIFIDWNIDGDFDDPGEEVASIDTSITPSSNTINITVPNIGYFGATRMRIVVQYNATSLATYDPNLNIGPCDVGGGAGFDPPWYGSTEDYSVVIAGFVPATYLWSNGSTTSQITSIASGTYYCTVTDTNGCSVVDSITLTDPTQISTIENVTNISCFGSGDGSVSLNISGGSAPYTEDWGGVNTSNLGVGTYNYTITDNNGCVFSDSIAITEPSQLQTSAIVLNASCNNLNDGSIDLTVSGGTAPYTYFWTDGLGFNSSSEDLNNIPSGIYACNIFDANGCNTMVYLNVTEPDELTSTFTSSDVSCYGGDDGSATVIFSGGTQDYILSWGGFNYPLSGGLNVFTTPLGVPAGIYPFTVTDANGCTDSDTIIISQPDSLNVNSSTTDVLCNGNFDGTAILSITGGVSPYIEDWGNFNPLNLGAGNYTYVVTDANGCSDSGAVSISQPDILTLIITSNNTSSCVINDGSIDLTVNGGIAPYSYLWNTNDTIEDLDSLTAGNYYVAVNDVNGCTISDSIFISQPSNGLILSLNGSNYNGYNISCNGGIDGIIFSNVSGGTGAITYSWSTGDSTSNINNLSYGNYILTITDANSCSLTDSILLTQPNLINTTYNTIDNLCYGESNGNADINISGGVQDYILTWDIYTYPLIGGVSNFVTPFGLPADIYPYSISDANGCIYHDTIVINEPDSIYTSLTLSNYNNYNISCNGENDGNIDIQINGGTGPYIIYFQDSLITNYLIENLYAGTYYDSIIDNNGCIFQESIILNEPNTISNTIFSTNLSCYNSCDGYITTNTNGGVSPFNYSWNNNLYIDDTLSSICADIYYLNITDANNCIFNDSVVLNQPNQININIDSIQDVSVYNGADGAIYINANGGVLNFSYEWIGPNNFYSNNQSIDNLIAGIYTLTVTDGDSCFNSINITVNQPPSLSVFLDSSLNNNCFGDCNGALYITADGGDSIYTYLWSGPNGFTSTNEDITNLCAGLYTLALSDTTDTIIMQFNVIEPNPITLIANADTALCYNGYAQANVFVYNAISPYQILWSNGATTNITMLQYGVHNVNVIDNNGCSSVQYIMVHQSDSISIESTIIDSISCYNAQDGSIELTVINGGTPPFYYSNDGGLTFQNSNMFFNIDSGTYYFTVSDINGCSATTSVTITEPTNLINNISISDVTCYNDCDGTVISDISGGTPPYNIDWGSANPNALCAGLYNVVVNDANGCLTVNNITVNQPNPLIVNITLNGSVLEASIGFSSYQWYDGQGNIVFGETSRVFEPTIEDNYSVLVVDSNGCSMMSNPFFYNINFIENKDYQLKIYPNPTSKILNIEMSNAIKNITLYDLTGEAVLIINENNINSKYELDLTNFSKGIYLVQIESNNEVFKQRIILQ